MKSSVIYIINIPYGQSSAKLPVIIIRSSGYHVIILFNIATDTLTDTQHQDLQVCFADNNRGTLSDCGIFAKVRCELCHPPTTLPLSHKPETQNYQFSGRWLGPGGLVSGAWEIGTLLLPQIVHRRRQIIIMEVDDETHSDYIYTFLVLVLM